jgi:hypothetical protein
VNIELVTADFSLIFIFSSFPEFLNLHDNDLSEAAAAAFEEVLATNNLNDR